LYYLQFVAGDTPSVTLKRWGQLIAGSTEEKCHYGPPIQNSGNISLNTLYRPLSVLSTKMECLLMTSVRNFTIWNDVEVKFTLETSGVSSVRTPTVNGSGEFVCKGISPQMLIHHNREHKILEEVCYYVTKFGNIFLFRVKFTINLLAPELFFKF